MKKKWLAIGIILLFLESCVIPIGSENIQKKNEISKITNDEPFPTMRNDWWPMFRHDLNHTGFSTSKAPNTNTVLWSYETGSIISSSPTVTNGKVYVSSYEEHKMYCLNASYGIKIWDFQTGDYMYSSAAVVNDKVYFGSGDGYVYCLNATTGGLIWSTNIGVNAYVFSSPTVTEGKVYIGSSDNKICCLNANNGSIIWIYNTGPDGDVESSPAVANNKVYVGCGNNNVYCLNATTGVKIWNYTTGGYIDSSPIISNGKIYIGSWDHNVYCLNASNGVKIWNYTTGGYIDSSPAIANDKIYIGSWDMKLYCLNATMGAKIWDYYTGDVVLSSPAVADNKVYVGAHVKVLCLNASTGEKIWDYITGSYVESSPAITDGKVYIGSDDHKVYCFGYNQPPNSPLITGPSQGKISIGIQYNFTAIDPDGNDVYYFIDWGDQTNSNWLGPYLSGDELAQSHDWFKTGTYTIKAKVKDIYGYESEWGTLSVKMPTSYNIPIIQFWTRLLERFPLLENLLSILCNHLERNVC